MRMFGIRLGYYSEDPEVCYQIDSMMDFVEDVIDIFFKYPLPKVAFHGELGDEDAWFANFWDRFIPVIENRLAKHGQKFLAGTKKPTIADFKAAYFWSTVFADTPNNFYPEAVRTRIMNKVTSEAPNFLRWCESMK